MIPVDNIKTVDFQNEVTFSLSMPEIDNLNLIFVLGCNCRHGLSHL